MVSLFASSQKFDRKYFRKRSKYE